MSKNKSHNSKKAQIADIFKEAPSPATSLPKNTYTPVLEADEERECSPDYKIKMYVVATLIFLFSSKARKKNFFSEEPLENEFSIQNMPKTSRRNE